MDIVKNGTGLVDEELLGRCNHVRHINFKNWLRLVDLDIKIHNLTKPFIVSGAVKEKNTEGEKRRCTCCRLVTL